MLACLYKSTIHLQNVIIKSLFAVNGVQAKGAFLGKGEDQVLEESETAPGSN
jgi:hypothetical protein